LWKKEHKFSLPDRKKYHVKLIDRLMTKEKTDSNLSFLFTKSFFSKIFLTISCRILSFFSFCKSKNIIKSFHHLVLFHGGNFQFIFRLEPKMESPIERTKIYAIYYTFSNFLFRELAMKTAKLNQVFFQSASAKSFDFRT